MNLFGEEVVEDVVLEEKVTKPNRHPVMEWLNAITQNKTDMRTLDSEMQGFDSFIINKGLMQDQGTIGFAALMNRMPHIPSEAQYLFYHHAIPKRRGYVKWAKSTKEDNLKEVMERTGYGKEKAKEVIRVLSPDQLKKLLTTKGGAGKKGKVKKNK